MLSTLSAGRLAVQMCPDNANHHLWLNHGTSLIHLWFHHGSRRHRLRASLGTEVLVVALSRRESVLADLRRHVPPAIASTLRARRSALITPQPQCFGERLVS